MYPNVREAVERGEVLIEWDGEGKPPLPLLKDHFASERRKAKTLNFSIAYGKTAFGLAKDWGVSKKEAEETVRLWYADRFEVQEWQETYKKMAVEVGYVTTLMGRRRYLATAQARSKWELASVLRGAINTPVQGGAADVVMCAMLNVRNNKRLKELGWKQLLQIHDEIMLEGPEESADEALEIVTHCMEHPFPKPLSVALEVSASIGRTWYDAK
jgi:DNA polymerase-1